LAVVERLFWQLGCVLVAITVVECWPLWRVGHCREVKIRVNVWTVRWYNKRGYCGEVAIKKGSTVMPYDHKPADVVKAHHSGPGSNRRPGIICGFHLLFVVVLH